MTTATSRAHPPVELVCAHCSERFTVPYRQRTRTYCSVRCFRQHEKEQARERYPRPFLRCAFCDRSFIPRRGAEARRQQYCSRECWNAQITLDAHLKTCNQCGATFYIKPSLARQGKGKYCSDLCRRRAERKRTQERARAAKAAQKHPPTAPTGTTGDAPKTRRKTVAV